MTIGVPARDIAKGFTTKLFEIDQHRKSLQRGVEIRAQMARYRDEPARLKRL